MMQVLILFILGLALTGCDTLYDAPPQEPMKLASGMSPQEWCRDAFLLMFGAARDVRFGPIADISQTSLDHRVSN